MGSSNRASRQIRASMFLPWLHFKADMAKAGCDRFRGEGTRGACPPRGRWWGLWWACLPHLCPFAFAHDQRARGRRAGAPLAPATARGRERKGKMAQGLKREPRARGRRAGAPPAPATARGRERKGEEGARIEAGAASGGGRAGAPPAPEPARGHAQLLVTVGAIGSGDFVQDGANHDNENECNNFHDDKTEELGNYCAMLESGSRGRGTGALGHPSRPKPPAGTRPRTCTHVSAPTSARK